MANLNVTRQSYLDFICFNRKPGSEQTSQLGNRRVDRGQISHHCHNSGVQVQNNFMIASKRKTCV